MFYSSVFLCELYNYLVIIRYTNDLLATFMYLLSHVFTFATPCDLLDVDS